MNHTFDDVIDVPESDKNVIGVHERGEVVPKTRIGLGKPLSIRIKSVFPGDNWDLGRDAILTSRVKIPMLYKEAPVAMNYWFSQLEYGKLAPIHEGAAGSDVIYYSPGLVDNSLDVSLRFAFDKFDRETYESWLKAAATAAALPVFAVAGPAAAAWVVAAQQAARLIFRFIDRRIDGRNDAVLTYPMKIQEPGHPRAKAGYVLFYPDGNELLKPLTLDDGRTPVVGTQFNVEDNLFEVDTVRGQLVWAGTEDVVLRGDPYVLAFVNGAPIQILQGWTGVAVSAALSARFLETEGSDSSDALEAFRIYNDVLMARQILEFDTEISSLDPTSKSKDVLDRIKELKAKRVGAVKNIQNSEIKASIPG